MPSTAGACSINAGWLNHTGSIHILLTLQEPSGLGRMGMLQMRPSRSWEASGLPRGFRYWLIVSLILLPWEAVWHWASERACKCLGCKFCFLLSPRCLIFDKSPCILGIPVSHLWSGGVEEAQWTILSCDVHWRLHRTLYTHGVESDLCHWQMGGAAGIEWLPCGPFFRTRRDILNVGLQVVFGKMTIQCPQPRWVRSKWSRKTENSSSHPLVVTETCRKNRNTGTSHQQQGGTMSLYDFPLEARPGDRCWQLRYPDWFGRKNFQTIESK